MHLANHRQNNLRFIYQYLSQMFDEISRTKLKKRTRCTYAQHSISSVVEFQRWRVLKSKVFHLSSSEETVLFCKYNELQFVKKCQNHTFKVYLLCQKSMDVFLIFFSFQNINLGDHFLLKTFFSDFNF